MKRRNIVIGAAVALALGAAALGFAPSSEAQPYGGWGMTGGPGWMHGGGPGWRGGYGHCPWFQRGPGAGGYGQQGNLNLSTDDVTRELERWLAFQDNPRLKLGDVKEKDADTIVADIVTKENSSLVQRFIVNRHTGFYGPDEG